MSGFMDNFRAQSLQRRSSALLNAGKYAEALPLCQELVALSPGSTAAWSDLGWALMATQRLDEAVAACETSISLNPSNWRAWNNKGAALTQLERYKEALAALDQACALDPQGLRQGRIKSHRNRLWPLIQLRRFDEVIAATDALIQYAPKDHEIWMRRGQALAERRRYVEAEEAFLFSAKLKSTDVALSQLAIFYANKTRAYDKAIEVTERLLALRPNDGTIWHLKGVVFKESGAYEDACNAYERAFACSGLSNDALGRLWSSMGYALVRLGRYRDALVALDKGALLAPGNAYTFINRGEVYSHIERLSDALACYEDARKSQPYVLLAQTNVAEVLVTLGSLDQAKVHLDEVFAVDPDDGCAWYVTGLRETALEHYDDALAAFDRSIALESRHASHYSGFAELLLKLDDARHACQVIERALALDPYDARAWKVKAEALRAAGREDEAESAERHGTELLAEQTAQVDAYLQAKREGSSER